jgi:glycosyltransferase involved in cell wall biosynthesis
VLIATIPAGIGGPQRHVEALCGSPVFRDHFDRRIWQVPDEYRGIAGKRALSQDAAGILRAERPDIAYLNVDLSLAFWLGLTLVRTSGVPLVFHSHSAAFESPRSELAQAAFRYGVRTFATRRIAVSTEAARAMFGSEQDTAIVPSLIDFAALHAAADASEPPFPRRRFTFACVGRLRKPKNQALAIRALAGIARSGMDADLVLVGDGDDRGDLESLALRIGVGDRVRITGEVASPGPIYRHLADAVLVPSLTEGQSRVVAEAQSFGLPVLASIGVPDSAWLLHGSHDRRGLPLQPGAWAQAMAALMADGSKRCPLQLADLDTRCHGLAGGSRLLVRLLHDAIMDAGRDGRRA